ncbi:hypothetical protein Vretimale_18146 [Volvox reticuliferus]|uniref:Uncharacterized protein n=1 Tax=Volvox reticuliferus TaxID=1737510 RepID=A0A8J4FZ38_9CHLO|nr:hypothetical protein Vretifemale_17787 [Volvox reticuliferus]GIM15277.1 hypothetical protein Vretimale_18146 [Volvox reticuliferus]
MDSCVPWKHHRSSKILPDRASRRSCTLIPAPGWERSKDRVSVRRPESLPVSMMGTADSGGDGAVTEADMRWYSSCNTWRVRKLVPLLVAARAQPGSVLGLRLAKLTNAAVEAIEPGFGAGYAESPQRT